MTPDEAKDLLELCRPDNAEDRQDPKLAPAFKLLETDSELAAWFEKKQAVDRRISEALQTIKAPEEFKAEILESMYARAQAKPSEDPEPAIAFPGAKQPASAWMKPLLGLAALFLIAFIAFTQIFQASKTDGTHAEWQSMVQHFANAIEALEDDTLEKRDASFENLRAYLTSRQAPVPKALPADLQNLDTYGCVTYQYNGATFSMVCFEEGDTYYHLFTAARAAFPGAVPNGRETFEIAGKKFELWADAENVYILDVNGTTYGPPFSTEVVSSEKPVSCNCLAAARSDTHGPHPGKVLTSRAA
ncbi:MAG: hypothetical protein GVY36_08845 [Verrucomicrobia bacterium]|jgi:hypothetical protein|nr:hypothetical protein [Verrucomicrobiota bacterium]